MKTFFIENTQPQKQLSTKYLSEEQIFIIKKITQEYPDTIFAGSLSLITHGWLQRKVGDLDIITKDNYYSRNIFYPKYRVSGSCASEQSIIKNGDLTWTIRTFKLEFPILENKINIDVIWKRINPEYTIFDLDGIQIKIENPIKAVDFKISYLKNNISVKNFKKHFTDILEILGNVSDIHRQYIIKKLSESIIDSKFINNRYDNNFKWPEAYKYVIYPNFNNLKK